MSFESAVVGHYTRPDLLTAIETALAKIAKTPETVTVEDLAPIDEFHIGGRPATRHLLDKLDFSPTDHILDVGCGIGGPSRLAIDGVAGITGIDLTPEYVDTGNELNRWLKLDQSIELVVGNALALGFDDETFDGGYMLHVGMNIEDKAGLLAELGRVLRPGALFGIYDIMRMGHGELAFPVPWASDPSTSHVAEPTAYRQAATDAGLVVAAEENRGEQARRFFEQAAAQATPPPLGLGILMGETFGVKVQNMVANVAGGLIAPVELVVAKPAAA
ncbi:MAG: class I SAM-dependent methyltransferase [Acidimicrobiales bacterium]